MRLVAHLERSEQSAFKLEFNRAEFEAMRSSFLETVMGFGLDDYERQLGLSEAYAEALLDRLCAMDAEVRRYPLGGSRHVAKVLFTAEELTAAKNALEETLQELGEAEYEARTDVPFDKGRSVLSELQRILDRL